MHRRKNFLLLLLAVFSSINSEAFAAYKSPARKPAVFKSYLLIDSANPEDMDEFPRWNSMVARYKKQQRVPDSKCGKVKYHPCEILKWKALLRSLKKKPFLTQLDAINNYINAFPYRTDQENWGVDNYWETPYEFLEVSGNCKDYAIIKYYSLRMLGVPQERLRLMVVKDLNLNGDIHAILGVNSDAGELYILDNQIKNVTAAKFVTRYKPVFTINEIAVASYAP